VYKQYIHTLGGDVDVVAAESLTAALVFIYRWLRGFGDANPPADAFTRCQGWVSDTRPIVVQVENAYP